VEEEEPPSPESRVVDEPPMTYDEVIQAIAVQGMAWSVVPIDTESDSGECSLKKYIIWFKVQLAESHHPPVPGRQGDNRSSRRRKHTAGMIPPKTHTETSIKKRKPITRHFAPSIRLWEGVVFNLTSAGRSRRIGRGDGKNIV
jgi:hypothetical protein